MINHEDYQTNFFKRLLGQFFISCDLTYNDFSLIIAIFLRSFDYFPVF